MRNLIMFLVVVFVFGLFVVGCGKSEPEPIKEVEVEEIDKTELSANRIEVLSVRIQEMESSDLPEGVFGMIAYLEF